MGSALQPPHRPRDSGLEPLADVHHSVWEAYARLRLPISTERSMHPGAPARMAGVGVRCEIHTEAADDYRPS